MPGGDRTGPRGEGPLTGRGAGYGGGYGMPGYMNPIPGRGAGFYGVGRGGLPWGGGRGRAWGGGRGHGWGYSQYPPGAYPPSPEFTKDQEIQELRAQADYFKGALDQINSRLDELQKVGEDK